MALFNYATKEITLKVVYYGPGLSGKTTNLQFLHSALSTSSKGKLLSLSTEADRTLFFDFLPVELGKIRDFSIRFQLYTVPGQVRYNATRRIVLKGADAVVFVADSQSAMREQNIESLENMRENLLANNLDPDDIPIVFQYNKRDLKDVASVDELNNDLNSGNYPVIKASAIGGTGVDEAFRLISKLLLQHISKKHKIEIVSPEEKKEPAPPQPAPPVFHKPASADLQSPAAAGEPGPAVQETRTPLRPDDYSYRRDAGAEPGAPRVKAEAEGEISGLASATGESVDRIIREIETMHESLKSMKDLFSAMRGEMKALSEAMRGEMKALSESGSVEMKALSEIRKTQQETNRLLRELKDFFADLKKKRRWFRF